jgi:hypothetical protein
VVSDMLIPDYTHDQLVAGYFPSLNDLGIYDHS